MRERELNHFMMLTQAEQRAAIVRLSRSGFSDYGIAAATSLSVEQIRKVLGEARAIEESAA
jgi:hypothetical protein